MLSIISKFKKNKKKHIRELNSRLISNINKIFTKIEKKKDITFLHSGHLGDLINSLPIVKEISKRAKCKFLIKVNFNVDRQNADYSRLSKNVFITKDAFNKICPLLMTQSYISKVEMYKKQKIDVNLDLFRDLPINFNIDSVRWYSHLTGVFPNLSKPYLLNIKKKSKYKNSIIIMRSLRRQNKHIKFNFLDNYKKLVFIGLYPEYLNLKKQIKNLSFYDCKDFLEMAEIIKSCKLFIGNLSFGYTIAEALKVPRLLESFLDFPLVYPNGDKGYEFYFQKHFEKKVKQLIN